MSEENANQETAQPTDPGATPETVSPAPTAIPAEHMIPKARLDEEIAKRKEFETQIKTLSKQQAEGSAAKAALEEISVQLQKVEKRALFLEQVTDPAIQCRNPKAAWLLVEAGDFFDKKGNPDFAALKAAAPELFGLPTARANAGTNTQSPPSPTQGMNDFIRKAAGHGT